MKEKKKSKKHHGSGEELPMESVQNGTLEDEPLPVRHLLGQETLARSSMYLRLLGHFVAATQLWPAGRFRNSFGGSKHYGLGSMQR